MTNPFTALDFETATGYRNSICQVGWIRVENRNIVKKVNLFVQLPDKQYWSRFTYIQGIAAKDTVKNSVFNNVWHQISHNGFVIDFQY